jgi:hypothetical protein
MIKAPRNIPYYYNRASVDQLLRLNRTFRHFGIRSHHPLVGETLLRLGRYVNESPVCLLPTDEPTRALFRMYKYYDALENDKAATLEH